MMLAGVAILLFYPLATMLIPTFQFMNKGLDIKFDASFITIEKQSDLFVAILATFYSELNTLLVLCVQIFICVVLAIYNYKVRPCLVSYMNPFKTGIYSISAYVTLLAILWQLTKSWILVTILFSAATLCMLGWVYYKYGGNLVQRIKKICAKIKSKQNKRLDTLKVLPISERAFQDIDQIKKKNMSESGISKAAIVPSPDKKKQKNEVSGIVKNIQCPQCRKSASSLEWMATFVESECCVCFESKKMVISSVCGHGMCVDCFSQF